MRARDSQIGFFHFSFLDILACTVGVLIFMIAIIVLHTLGMSAPPPLRKELSKLRAAVSALQKQISQKEAELAERKRRVDAISKFAWLLRSYDEKSAEKARIEAQLAELERRTRVLEQKIKQDRQLLMRLQAQTAEKPKIRQKSIRISTPVERRSSKRPVYFECDGGRVNPFFGRYIRKYYSVTQVGQRALVARRRAGETLAEARDSASDWAAELARLDPSKQYVAFIVRPSGFEIFLKLRSVLRRRGIDVGWEPVEAGVSVVVEGPEAQNRFLLQ